MNVRSALALPFSLFLLLSGCGENPGGPTTGEHRIVTLGGSVTEVVFALGAGDEVVATDQGSLYPPEVFRLPRLNYHRQLSPEGTLSANPTVILHTAAAGPPDALRQLRDSGVEMALVEEAESVEGAYRKIARVGEALGREDAAESLIASLRSELEVIADEVATSEERRPRVLFVYARQGIGAPNVGGSGTGADEMIRLAGGVNVASELEGYRPLTPEAIVGMEPDVILVLDRGLDVLGGPEGLFAVPGVASTPAGENRHFVSMPDDLLLSFGPRLPQAVRALREALQNYDEPQSSAEVAQR